MAREQREVLDRATEIRIDRTWSTAEVERARAFADDPRVAAALEHCDQFGLAEYLAAGPKLLAAWEDGWAPSTHPRGAAIVAAAVDARRAGFYRGLTPAALRILHEPYLRQRGGARLRPESWEQALAWATRAVYATTGLLMPEGPDHYVAFDYAPIGHRRRPRRRGERRVDATRRADRAVGVHDRSGRPALRGA
jgi:hypothetical protein